MRSTRNLIGNSYTSDMRRCDIKIHVKPEITPWLKYHNMMEIVDQVAQDFASTQKSRKKVVNLITIFALFKKF